MKFSKCPNCTNHEKGYQILQCKKCGHIGCNKPAMFTKKGCWSGEDNDFTICPKCKEFAFLGHRILHVLGE